MLFAKPFSCFFLLLVILQAVLLQNVHAQIEIQDSHGKYRFEAVPERVVVLNWALAEQMLELGVVPVGMADISGYERHSGELTVPASVIDVGERLAPKLSEIRALKPDIIVIGYSQRPYIRPLSNIATIIYFKNFGKRYNNAEKSRERFSELAKLFDKTKEAVDKLQQRDAHLASLKNQLHSAYVEHELPVVQFIVPDASNAAKDGVSLLFGDNSMPFYAATALGLEVVSAPKNDQFGLAQLTSGELIELTKGYDDNLCQFYLSSYVDSARSVLNLPKDQKNNHGCVIDMEYQNAFGGVMSIQYLAEAMVKQLIEQLGAKK